MKKVHLIFFIILVLLVLSCTDKIRYIAPALKEKPVGVAWFSSSKQRYGKYIYSESLSKYAVNILSNYGYNTKIVWNESNHNFSNLTFSWPKDFIKYIKSLPLNNIKNTNCEIMIIGIDFPGYNTDIGVAVLGKDMATGKVIFHNDKFGGRSLRYLYKGQNPDGTKTYTYQFANPYVKDMQNLINLAFKDFQIH